MTAMNEEMPRVRVISSAPIRLHAGPLEFKMMSRKVNEDHGGTLEIYGQVDGERHELLKFDCFEQGPHWHRCRIGQKDEITNLNPPGATDALRFTMETLRTRFGSLIDEQGFGSLTGS